MLGGILDGGFIAPPPKVLVGCFCVCSGIADGRFTFIAPPKVLVAAAGAGAGAELSGRPAEDTSGREALLQMFPIARRPPSVGGDGWMGYCTGGAGSLILCLVFG